MARSKVLIAESDAAQATALSKLLKQAGYETFVAADAVHVVNLAKTGQPDVIFLSARLAGGSLAALRRIRSNVHTSTIPVVGLAAAAGPLRKEMIAAGAQECVDPAAGEHLGDAVERNMLESLDFTQAPAAVLEAPERLADLRDTGLLDSSAEESFDLLTHLITRLLGAPTALVTLVDRDRQFFKSQAGLAEPWASARQTRLTHSFCQWVVSGREQMVIPDATQVPALRRNLAIQDMGVIAYVGVPLSGAQGQAIGSLCAIDSKPHDWSESDLDTLRDLAVVTEAQAIERALRGQVPNETIGRTIAGLARVLRRYAERLSAEDRDAILSLLEKQATLIGSKAR